MNEKAAAEIEPVLRRLLEGFCFYPEDLKLWVTDYSGVVNVRLQGHAEDTPRIIGPNGKQFKSLCKVAQEVGRKHGARVILSDVEQPTVGEEKSYGRFEPAADWPRLKLLEHVEAVAKAVFRFPESVRISYHDTKADETIVEVRVSQRERGELVRRMDEAFGSLFNAIGRRHGRVLRVVVVARVPSDDSSQPRRADGRHVKEVSR